MLTDALVVLAVVTGLAGVLYLAVRLLLVAQVERERKRIEQEVRLAEWQMRLLVRRAMRQMLDVARRHQHW